MSGLRKFRQARFRVALKHHCRKDHFDILQSPPSRKKRPRLALSWGAKSTPAKTAFNFHSLNSFNACGSSSGRSREMTVESIFKLRKISPDGR
ncbi:MAG: hypothetical protein M3521_03340 [Acidobacteriota bacterium]|nr:hypothetical protein [Acidobacteriota bacterium]